MNVAPVVMAPSCHCESSLLPGFLTKTSNIRFAGGGNPAHVTLKGVVVVPEVGWTTGGTMITWAAKGSPSDAALYVDAPLTKNENVPAGAIAPESKRTTLLVSVTVGV